MEAKDGFDYLSNFISSEIWFFLVGLATIVFYLILTRKINTRKLLFEKNQSRTYSWQRVQLLVITLAGVMFYLIEVKHNLSSGKLPQVSEELLLILSGSNVFYLGSKFYSLLLRREVKPNI